MELGIGLFTGQQRPDDERTLSEIYDEMLELAAVTDAAGLDSAWVSEHHFMEDSYLSGVTPTLGAFAAVTEDIEIGTCIALAPLYDSVRLAEDVATTDQIAGGRTTLGLAIGYNQRELDAFGVDPEERTDRIEDAVKTLRGAWSPGALEYDPSYHDISPSLSVTPKPAHDIPIMLGGSARPAVRRAARMGDAWCAPSSLSIDGIQKRKTDIENVREEAGIEGDFQVYVLQHGFLGDSREDAWEKMKEGYLYSNRRYAEIQTGDPVTELAAERKQELKERAIFGTPEQVTAELDEYRERLGDDVHFILRVYHPGVGTDAMADCIRELGATVKPSL